MMQTRTSNSIIKETALCAMLTAILFVQEEILTFLPNIQLTVLLIMCYAATLKFYQVAAIVFVHVLLDNLVMGSMNLIVMVPMYIGWMLVALLGFLTKNKPIWLVTIASVFGALMYDICFVVANALFLDIDIRLYILADIPFDILLCTSSAISIIFLYELIVNFIKKQLISFREIKEG